MDTKTAVFAVICIFLLVGMVQCSNANIDWVTPVQEFFKENVGLADFLNQQAIKPNFN